MISTLTVGQGEIVGLLGPNGSGKTTALNLMSGVLRPDAGTIRLTGQDIAGLPPTGSRGSASPGPSSSCACSTGMDCRENVKAGLAFQRSRICRAADDGGCAIDAARSRRSWRTGPAAGGRPHLYRPEAARARARARARSRACCCSTNGSPASTRPSCMIGIDLIRSLKAEASPSCWSSMSWMRSARSATAAW